ncbi:hypothetical protein IHE44_0014111 [Lamprotornis superbus]|uniref:Uncharacterized protein n=1 Tax=Lamprotornis superbus TaxID=245042 RepID=A0A835NKG7_9PASS|nr:hypothetical protein IHE44_0014111 [Lamprotornis superbus]
MRATVKFGVSPLEYRQLFMRAKRRQISSRDHIRLWCRQTDKLGQTYQASRNISAEAIERKRVNEMRGKVAILVLHQTLMPFFNVLKYQCFIEASQI